MITINSKAMKKLRRKRKEKGLCTRCGGERENKEYVLCQDCRDYLKEYKVNYTPPPKEQVIIRKLKKWDVTNRKLYNTLIAEGISIPELAEAVNVTPRSVDRWIFENAEPRPGHKEKVNVFLKEEIYPDVSYELSN